MSRRTHEGLVRVGSLPFLSRSQLGLAPRANIAQTFRDGKRKLGAVKGVRFISLMSAPGRRLNRLTQRSVGSALPAFHNQTPSTAARSTGARVPRPRRPEIPPQVMVRADHDAGAGPDVVVVAGADDDAAGVVAVGGVDLLQRDGADLHPVAGRDARPQPVAAVEREQRRRYQSTRRALARRWAARSAATRRRSRTACRRDRGRQ